MTEQSIFNQCKLCLLYDNFNSYVPSFSASDECFGMIIGEAPGAEEVREKKPFCGDSGKELDGYLLRAGIPRSNWHVTNVVKCRPPKNRDPVQKEIDCCSDELRFEMEMWKPRIIVALGKIAAQVILGKKIDMEMVHGIPITIGNGIVVIPCYHPAFALRNTSKMTDITNDIEMVVKVIRNNFKIQGKKTNTLEYKKLDNVKKLQKVLNRALNIIAIDTESVEDNKPWCLTFSVSHGEGFLIRSDQVELIKMVAEYVAEPNVVTIIHNALWDLNILAEMKVYPRQVRDTMIMAYLLQTHPQGLKPLAFRLLGMEMESYEDVIREAQEAKSIQYMVEVLSRVWPNPEQVLVMTPSGPKIKKPQNISKKVKRALDSFGKDTSIDLVQKWAKMEGKEEVEKILGKMPMGYVSDVPENEVIEYACKDAIATFGIYPILAKQIKENGLGGALHRDLRALGMVSGMMRNGIKINPNHFSKLEKYFDLLLCKSNNTINNHYTKATGKIKIINPGSTEQVSEMLWEIGIFRNKKQSTASEALDKVRDRHPIINEISNFRQIQKLKGTYTHSIVKAMDDDNRVHTKLRVTGTITGRLSSSRPNLQNQPIRSELGRKIREGFISGTGCVLLSNDYSQIEMRMLAHCSKDETMLDMFRTGKDIHSETAAWIFKIPLDKVDNDKHRYPAKRVGFGIVYGLTASGLQRQLLAEGIRYDISECEGMIRGWYSMYPQANRYLRETKTFARRYGYVSDIFGRKRLTPEVKSVHERIREAGLRQAINAPIQMGAQGVIKEAMGNLTSVYTDFESQGYVCRPLLQIHDDLLFEVSEDILNKAAKVIKDTMENAVKLDILTPVDQKIGKTWGNMKKLILEGE